RGFFNVTKDGAGTARLRFTTVTTANDDPNIQITFATDSCTVTPSTSVHDVKGITTGTPQEISLTVTGGPAQNTADLFIQLTAPGMTGTPKFFSIEIPSGSTNAQVATAIAAALSGDPD